MKTTKKENSKVKILLEGFSLLPLCGAQEIREDMEGISPFTASEMPDPNKLGQ